MPDKKPYRSREGWRELTLRQIDIWGRMARSAGYTLWGLGTRAGPSCSFRYEAWPFERSADNSSSVHHWMSLFLGDRGLAANQAQSVRPLCVEVMIESLK